MVETGFQQAFMASSNYIRKNILLLPNGVEKSESLVLRNAIPYDESEELLKSNFSSLTGVPVSFEAAAAMQETKRRNSDSMYSWLKIQIPSSEYFLELSKSMKEQSKTVLNGIFEQKNLSHLFISEFQDVMNKVSEKVKNIDEQTNKLAVINSELHEYYKLKRDELLSFDSALEFVNYLNYKNVLRDPEQTAAFLYTCGIKGVSYTDSFGKRALLFNARDDIEVCEIFKAVDINSIKQ